MPKPTNKNKCIIYCRVSSKEQEDKGYSLEAQEKALKEYAIRKELEISKVYKISESASGKQIRTTFNEMLKHIKKSSINIILCEKIDRLTRNLKDAAIVNDWVNDNKNHEVHFVKENFVVNQNTRAHENLVWDMKVAIARFYTNNLSEEVKKGQKAKIEAGWLPQRACLGYMTVGDKGHKIQVVDEKIAPLIREMFELYSSGNYSLSFLAEVMFDEGLKSQTGKIMAKTTLHNMLTNPFYCGKIVWNNNITQGKHEPIIDDDLFDKVQIKIKRQLSAPQYKKHLFLLKGLVRCAECGGVITWETQKGHVYGHCNHYRSCSQTVRVKEEEILEQIIKDIEKITPKTPKLIDWLERAVKDGEHDDTGLIESKATALGDSLKTIEKRLDALYNDKLDGKISIDFYDRKFEEFSSQRDNVLRSIGKINPEGQAKNYEKGIKIHRLACEAKDLILNEQKPVEDKRIVLSEIFSNFELNADKIRPKYTLGGEFLAEWIPVVNTIFEPEEIGLYYNKTGLLRPACSTMLGDRDSNPNKQDQNLLSYL